jgi:hypothetical protein
MFSAFADEAGRSEAAAKASADEAARQAGLVAEQMVAAAQAVDEARAALDAEHRRLRGARDDLLRFVAVIES